MTTTRHKSSLHSRLVQAYPNQAKGLAGRPIHIRIDDRDSDDIYCGFCDIHLMMSDAHADQITLTLDNVPFDDEVKSVAAEMNGSWESTRTGQRLTLILELSASQTTELRRLATAIRKVVGRGRRYLDSNWKWIARRAADSLHFFATQLRGCRAQGRE